MTEIAGAVQQQSDTPASDGSTRSFASNRMGALVTSSPQAMYDQWLRAGKVFEAHFATEGGSSTIEANATYDATEPWFRLTVPSSKIFVPIKVKVTPTTVWVTTDMIVLSASDTDTYNTGGAAPDVRNLAAVSSADSEIGTTAMTSVFDGDAALTENAMTDQRIIDITVFRTGGLYLPYEYNILKGDPMVMIHGTSSFVANAMLAGALEVHYSVVWAELDKNELVNAQIL